jgi:hypothetical protein
MFKEISIVLLLLSGFAFADYSIYCGLMNEIYGVCSEELVLNYLAHVFPIHVNIPPRIAPKPVIPQPAITASVQTFNTPQNGSVEGQTACWYWTPAGWKKCRMLA